MTLIGVSHREMEYSVFTFFDFSFFSESDHERTMDGSESRSRSRSRSPVVKVVEEVDSEGNSFKKSVQFLLSKTL